MCTIHCTGCYCLTVMVLVKVQLNTGMSSYQYCQVIPSNTEYCYAFLQILPSHTQQY
jgi:hypothetical protein